MFFSLRYKNKKGVAIFITRGKNRGILRGLSHRSNAAMTFTLFCLFCENAFRYATRLRFFAKFRKRVFFG
ncbi:hypothetical protein A9L79_07660 [Campylobacter coli]|nr:hypothetical protein [Campylobacter coli]